MTTIYRLARRVEWEEALRIGRYEGNEVDRRDGFLHLSSAEQVRESAARHLAGVSDLLLLQVDANALGEALVWEPSRGGALFPHLYGALRVEWVISVCELPLGVDGRHVFPASIPGS